MYFHPKKMHKLGPNYATLQPLEKYSVPCLQKKSNEQPLAKAQNDYSLVVGLRNRLKFGNVHSLLTSNSSILGDGETFSPTWGLVSVQSR